MQGIYDLLFSLSFTLKVIAEMVKVTVFVCLFVTCMNLNRNKIRVMSL